MEGELFEGDSECERLSRVCEGVLISHVDVVYIDLQVFDHVGDEFLCEAIFLYHHRLIYNIKHQLSDWRKM